MGSRRGLSARLPYDGRYLVGVETATEASRQVHSVLFATQNASLQVFYELAQALRHEGGLERASFYVSDEGYFDRFRAQTPDVESDSYTLLKEWEVVRDSASHEPDMAELRKFEETLDVDCLWSVLIADRRVYGGPCATLHQDHRQRFEHRRMLAILNLSLRRMEQLFDAAKPDLVVGFICVTLGDYLAYLFAKARGIPYLNLRPTRMQNYMYAGESVFEWSESFVTAYQDRTGYCPASEAVEIATSHLAVVRATHSRYEGIIRASAAPPQTTRVVHRSPPALVKRVLEMALQDLRSFFSGDWSRHRPGILESVWFVKVHRPLRARRMRWTFRHEYVYEEDLPALDYAFFPLHAEPEMQLNVYNRRYLNQIEAVRSVAGNLPVGMKLLVKEHPWTVGRRPLSYYRKLLKIPNVRLVSPAVESRPLILNARLMTMISGSIALEAAMLGKPVVTLGKALFNVLSPSMVCCMPPVEELAQRIQELLRSYEYDDSALVRYFATVVEQSVAVDWYSRLLKRPESERDLEESERREQIANVARYLLRRADELYGAAELNREDVTAAHGDD